ncbi:MULTISPECIES: lipid kinase [unclassified Methylophaga]|uniref:lipid kinase n=1 Tax=unclassified Methylophaga TaxID=2629249 RepID=UPI000C8F60DD|nr:MULTISPECIES: lipid kinase [unclassified Methylophaga]MBN46167.1 diacylglycerol kinase [Methylophaga sp.]
MQHALLIINPHSRNGQAEALEEAVQLLEASGIEVSVCESESEAHLISLIEAYEREDGIIILAGGDGTISSALDAIYTCQRTLAIFPMGTANDLARSIGVPEDLLSAAQVIVDGRRERISLGKVNKQAFINVAHVGLGVDVTRELTSDSKKFFGVFAYLGAFFKAIKRNKSFKVHIKADDWQCSTKAIHLAIGNGRFYGGGNIVDQRSTLLDGQLNLFFIKPQRWWQLLLLGPQLRNGDLHTTDRIVRKTAEKFSIQTTKPKALEADGEAKTATPADFDVIPKAIEAIVGDMPTATSGTV